MKDPACPDCGGRGMFKVEGCPADYAASCGFFDVLRARNLMEKGIPPVAGGQLDQCGSFVAAVREIDHNAALIEDA